jgi:hypothetical protein
MHLILAGHRRLTTHIKDILFPSEVPHHTLTNHASCPLARSLFVEFCQMRLSGLSELPASPTPSGAAEADQNGTTTHFLASF